MWLTFATGYPAARVGRTHSKEETMSVIVIVNTNVKNPEAYEEYKAQARPLVEQNGGRYLVRGGPHEVIEGSWNPTRLVVIEFPDKEAFESFYNSPEYKEVMKIRHANADSDMVVAESM
jgi:uncharacterized protein (DUF1330 family)